MTEQAPPEPTKNDREQARAWLVQAFGYVLGPAGDLQTESLARLLAKVRAEVFERAIAELDRIRGEYEEVRLRHGAEAYAVAGSECVFGTKHRWIDVADGEECSQCARSRPAHETLSELRAKLAVTKR